MSRQNVELVRASFEAFGRGDFDTAFAVYDPVVEWHTADDEPDSRTYTGLAELRAFVAHLADPWTDRFGRAITFEDFIDCGDWIVAPCSGRLHGHGRIVRVEEYRTVDEALDAVNCPQT